MRLSKLNLIRYGRFTDRLIELPHMESDFHVVFGLNEAGKSTAMSAIEDLLFGMPSRSSYNFLHDYKDMLVEGHLENNSSSLQIFRRKGKNNTLLDENGTPIPGGESILRPYLGNADPSLFERMFCLDHNRLRTGGENILKAEDDLGQIIFSAVTGIERPQELLDELLNEAEKIWAPRRARDRSFYIAKDRLEDHKKSLRELIVTGENWTKLKRAHEAAENSYSRLNNEIEELDVERNRLIRIRRVIGDIRKLHELEERLKQLGEVPELPESAATELEEAERSDETLTTEMKIHQSNLKLIRDDLKGLTVDEKILQNADDVRLLHERRIQIIQEKIDLPKREVELKAVEKQLQRCANQLQWQKMETASLIKRIPPRSKVNEVRSLLNERSGLEAEVTTCEDYLVDSQERFDQLRKQRNDMEVSQDVSDLKIILKLVSEQGDLPSEIKSAEKEYQVFQKSVERSLSDLNPGVVDDKTLLNMTVPVLENVKLHREQEKDWDRRNQAVLRDIKSVSEELDRLNAEITHVTQVEDIITVEELQDVRRYRNVLWDLVKLKHIQGKTIPKKQANEFADELKNLAGAIEPVMEKADHLSDRRFDHAESAGQVAQINREACDLEVRLRQLQDDETNLGQECGSLQDKWKEMWASVPIHPLDTETMLVWLDSRKEILEKVKDRESINFSLDNLRKQESNAKNQLLEELEKLGVTLATLKCDSLRLIIKKAEAELYREELLVRDIKQLEVQIIDQEKDVARRSRNFKNAKEAFDNWNKNWVTALSDLGIDKNASAQAVKTQTETIDEMRGIADQYNQLKDERIAKIQRDIAKFDDDVRNLVEVLAHDLLGEPSENAVLELEDRLKRAESNQELKNRKNDEANELSTKIAEINDNRKKILASISHLLSRAKVDSNVKLRDAITRSDEFRSVECERQEITEKLENDGDGKSIEELKIECHDEEIDTVIAHDGYISNQLEDLRKQLIPISDEKRRTWNEFQSIGGDDAVAKAEAGRQSALAELNTISGRYVRARTSAILLQWAIDRFRKEKQAPLLKQASNLFETVTCGSFANLEVKFDENDNAYLTGVRPDGSTVPVTGMSAGTTDQLYLTLRIAAIIESLNSAEAKPLPFVADDLFVNFDDERAQAGCELLFKLSRKTQVLFFTHHQHLVDMARKSLGDSINVVELTD